MSLLFCIHPVLCCHEVQGVVERAEDEVLVDDVAAVEADQLSLGHRASCEQPFTLNVRLPDSDRVVLEGVHQGGQSPELMVGG